MSTGKYPFADEITQYSSERILKIIENAKDYAPQLVYGCRVEADVRELDLEKPRQSRTPSDQEIAFYTDQRLIEIIQNGDDYLPQHVYGCRAEADSRALDIDSVRIPHKIIEDDMNIYNDHKLIELTKNRNAYSPKINIACMAELANRNLNIKGQTRIFRRDEIMEVQQKLSINVPLSEIKSSFLTRGFSEEDTLKLIEKAVASEKVYVPSEGVSETSEFSIIRILLLIVLVFRMLYNLSNK